MNDKQKYLPVGTVVILKNAQRRLMIIGYGARISDDNNLYDYAACFFPEGIINAKFTIAFNNEDIDKVFHAGLNDDEFTKFEEKLAKVLNKEEKKYE